MGDCARSHSQLRDKYSQGRLMPAPQSAKLNETPKGDKPNLGTLVFKRIAPCARTVSNPY